MDSDEDFKHYSSCFYDEDDVDRAFYPENAQRRLQLDSKSWFDSDKPIATGIFQHTQQCPPQQLMLDNIVTSSDKLCTGKNVNRWNCNTRLSKDLPCDVEANSQQSVSIRFLHNSDREFLGDNPQSKMSFFNVMYGFCLIQKNCF